MKKLIFLFTLICGVANAQVRVPGVLTNGGNAYPVAPFGMLQGVPQIVPDMASLSNSASWVRAAGQTFYVVSSGLTWRLVGGTNNSNLQLVVPQIDSTNVNTAFLTGTNPGAGGYEVDIRTFGALCDYNTDDSVALTNAIWHVYQLGGGTVVIPVGKTVIAKKIIIPNDNTPFSDPVFSRQPWIRITGYGNSEMGMRAGPSAVYGGSTLCLRYEGTNAIDAKIATYGLGVLEIDHLTLTSDNNPGSTNAIIATTGTTLRIHDNQIRNETDVGTNCLQDGILLGSGSIEASPINSPNSVFQGYDSQIIGNNFDHLRTAVLLNSWNDHTVVMWNYFNASGGDVRPKSGAIMITGTTDGTAAHTIIGNRFQSGGYPYMIYMTNCIHTYIAGNDWEDHFSPNNVGFVYLDELCFGNDIHINAMIYNGSPVLQRSNIWIDVTGANHIQSSIADTKSQLWPEGIPTIGKTVTVSNQTVWIGAGPATPTVQFEVQGSSKFSSNSVAIDGAVYSSLVAARNSGESIILQGRASASAGIGTPSVSVIAASGLYPTNIAVQAGGAGGPQVTILQNGKTGVGTETPGAKLTVEGDGTTTGKAFQVTDSIGTALATFLDSGNVGIGVANPSLPLQVEGAASFSSGSVFLSGGVYSSIISTRNNSETLFLNGRPSATGLPGVVVTSSGLYSTNITFQVSAGDEYASFYVRQDGNVGVGVAAPTSRLVVRGVGTTTGKTFQAQDSTGSQMVTILDSGNVGIGVANPSVPLHVEGAAMFSAGSVYLGGGVYSSIVSTRNNGETLYLNGRPAATGLPGVVITSSGSYPTNTTLLVGGVSELDSVYILQNGNVGIGTSNATSALHVIGTNWATMGFTSDGIWATRMPTNGPADGQVFTATGSLGHAKWAAIGSGGISLPLTVNTVLLTNGSGGGVLNDGLERDFSVITNFSTEGRSALQWRTASTYSWLGADINGNLLFELPSGTKVTIDEDFEVVGDAILGVTAVGGGTAIASILSATATLNFGSILAATSADLTITVTGAAVNDAVQLGPPAGLEGSVAALGIVTAADTVTVRLFNIGAISVDPASATWRATVTHY